ncbi:WASH complex subunit 5-like isoform X3 [Phoenix dactylifera]|uniref:WASH complex subunit 5-like isoform X3 n=1 Tax=Phoenix dactylifera TaxID=42345 RepID=A0A8B9ASF3_PHODC|nr:WASH complex subunit 5-like isoform X3 [Phoenix dactylifera]
MESSKKRAGSREDDDPAASFPELLNFCARAQTLIAELLLLSDRIPAEFLDRRFDAVLFDLRYFDSPNDFESRIEGNEELEALEDCLRESCSAYMQRFFLLMTGAVIYHLELLKYLNDLQMHFVIQEGLYGQSTLDRVLDNQYGRQLLTESIALFGCMLILMEHCLSGHLREKLLVAHLRHDCCFDSPNLEHICLICRAHMPPSGPFHHSGSPFVNSGMVSVQKTEDLFARFPFPKLVVDAVIHRLRNDDLYNQVHHYPDPQHRTVALSLQSGYLYILLFYSPEFLRNGFVMREIVDRFFRDCWVVPIFLHFVVDLFVSWDAYKEAKASLSSSVSPTFIRDCCQYHCTKVTHLSSELGSVLSNCVLIKDYVLDNSQYLISLVRDCNIALRWVLLHRASGDKRSRDIVTSVGLALQVDEDNLLQLLLKTSQLEFKVKQLYVELLESKEALWLEKKHCVSNCIEELSVHCFGSWVSSCKIKNESLNDWFQKLSTEVQSLDCTRTGSSSRAIYRVLSALKDLEQFCQIDQIKQWLFEAQKYLQDMIKVLNLDDEAMSTFSAITDALYAWAYVARFGELLGKNIEQDPSVVLSLHTYFLKFWMLLNVPLRRIEQNQSSDLLCVSNYYSSKYAAQICATLEIIPVILLGIYMDDNLQAQQPFHQLSRIDKDSLPEFMQVDQQLNLARAANKISIISEDLEDWLEGQVRKELSKRLENKLKTFFLLPNVGYDILEVNLRTLSAYILSQLQMMESFQDLLHIPGNRIWEETFTKVLKQCFEKEYAAFIKREQGSIVSVAQLNDFSKAPTFYGHLLHQLLRLTDPSRSMFIEPMSGWFDAEGHELLGLHFINLIESCVGQVGLASLDSLLTAIIKENLEYALKGFKNSLDSRCLEELRKLDDSLGPPTSLPLLGWSSYMQMGKVFIASWEPLVECLATIGQLQLLRRLISFQLKCTCKVKAALITSAAEGMLSSIYCQRRRILECMEEKDKDKDGANLGLFLQALDEQRKIVGLLSPLQAVHISSDPPIFLGRCAFIFSISQLSRYVLDSHLGTLTSRLKKSIIDFSPVVIGIGTFLRQFHPSHMNQYVQYMGQYIRTIAETAFGTVSGPHKGSPDPAEVLKSAFWLMCFCKYMDVSEDLANSCLPPSFIAILQT